MTEHAQHDSTLGYIAGDIMFSDNFRRVLEQAYSDENSLATFEAEPRDYLIAHGVDIPDGIDVVLHDPGTVGRPGRVDFNWDASAAACEPEPLATLRNRSRLAWDILHSHAMKQLRQRLATSPEAREEFATDPRGYALAHEVWIPGDFEIILHADGREAPRIDIHFRAMQRGPGDTRRYVETDGCCQCGVFTCGEYSVGYEE